MSIENNETKISGGSWYYILASCDAKYVYAMKPVCKHVNLFFQSVKSIVE